MNKKVNLLISRLRNSFLLFFLFPCILIGQDATYKLQSNQLTSVEILKKWSQLSDKVFNYRVNDLSQDKLSFSIEGTYQQVSDQLYPLLGLQYKEIDEVTIITKSSDVIIPSDDQVISVKDENRMPLPYAYVSIEALGILDITSSEGQYPLAMPVADSDTILFKYMGYEDTYLTFGDLKAYEYQITLRPSLEAISEVIILGSQTSLTTVEGIDPEDIPQAGSVDRDALTVAQAIPGINNPSESFQDLVIRGGSPDQVQYQWNGIRVLQSSHFFGKVSAINPYMIDKLEVSKDGYSASSRGTIAGGLHMKSDSHIDKASTTFHLNMLYGNLGVSLPISSKLSTKFAIRQSLPRGLQSSLSTTFIDQTFQFGKIPDEQFLIDVFGLSNVIRRETGVTFGDQQLSLSYQPHPKTTFQLDLMRLYNQLDFQKLSEERDIATQDILEQSNHGLHISGRHIWSAHFSTFVNANYADYGYQYTEYPTSTDLSIINQNQINDIAIGNVTVSNKLNYGLLAANFGYEHNTWDAKVVFANRAINEEDVYENQSAEEVLYLTLHPHISSNLALDLGVRWSAYNKSLNNRKLLEPRLHAKYKVGPALSIHGHYGKYHQYLSRRNFFTPLQADNGFWYISDESTTDFLDYIDIVQSTQFGGGFDIAQGLFELSLDVYDKEIRNIWSASFDLSIDENPFRVSDLSAYGVETMVAIKKQNHHLRLTYEYTNEDIAYDNIDNTSVNPFSQPHRLSATYEHRWKFLLATIQYNFAKGRPFTQANDLITITDDNGLNSRLAIAFDNLLDARTFDYHRVDLSIRTAPIGTRSKHSFGIQVNNLFNRDNIIKNQYFIDYKVSPAELAILEKRGVPQSFNIFWEVTIE